MGWLHVIGAFQALKPSRGGDNNPEVWALILTANGPIGGTGFTFAADGVDTVCVTSHATVRTRSVIKRRGMFLSVLPMAGALLLAGCVSEQKYDALQASYTLFTR